MNEEEVKKLLAENNKVLSRHYNKVITYLLDGIQGRDGLIADTYITAKVLLDLLVVKGFVSRQEVNAYEGVITSALENRGAKSFDIEGP